MKIELSTQAKAALRVPNSEIMQVDTRGNEGAKLEAIDWLESIKAFLEGEVD